MMGPMTPPMEEMETEAAPTSPILAALEQAQKALDEAIVQMTMKKREAPPMEEAAEGEAPPALSEEE